MIIETTVENVKILAKNGIEYRPMNIIEFTETFKNDKDGQSKVWVNIIYPSDYNKVSQLIKVPVVSETKLRIYKFTDVYGNEVYSSGRLMGQAIKDYITSNNIDLYDFIEDLAISEPVDQLPHHLKDLVYLNDDEQYISIVNPDMRKQIWVSDAFIPGKAVKFELHNHIHEFVYVGSSPTELRYTYRMLPKEE